MVTTSSEFRRATRRSVSLLLSVASVSGGGKTYSSLLLAAGIAGPNGKVGFIDTENGRGEMYADSPGIMKALPNGYLYARLDPPFSPARYIEKIKAAEEAGIDVCVIDSATHEWEGIGGCQEIAEKNPLGGMPNWAKAKMEHKRFVNHCLSSRMHIIFCLRAREKSKVLKKGDRIVTGLNDALSADAPLAEKNMVIDLGVQAIQEKNFVFEMLVSLYLDEHTHCAFPTKVPEPLLHLFDGKRLLTKEDGERIRQWNETGTAADPAEQLIKRGAAEAEKGMRAYRAWYESLTPPQRKSLGGKHTEYKNTAEEADRIPVFGSAESPVQWPDSFDGPECFWNGNHLVWNDNTGNYERKEAVA